MRILIEKLRWKRNAMFAFFFALIAMSFAIGDWAIAQEALPSWNSDTKSAKEKPAKEKPAPKKVTEEADKPKPKKKATRNAAAAVKPAVENENPPAEKKRKRKARNRAVEETDTEEMPKPTPRQRPRKRPVEPTPTPAAVEETPEPSLVTPKPIENAPEGQELKGEVLATAYDELNPELVTIWPTSRYIQRDEISFEKHLFVSSDIRMRGQYSSYDMTFTVPEHWNVRGYVELSLIISHSMTLDPRQSGVSIFVNGHSVFSLWLNESNINTKRYVIRIPVNIIRDFNTLRFEAFLEKVGDEECEDPFDPSLWMLISRESSINIRYLAEPIKVNLSQFPFPLYDNMSYSHLPVEYYIPENPSLKTFQAMARFQASMGRHIQWRDFDYTVSLIEPQTKLENPAIFIGTPDENKAIMQFADLPDKNRLPLPLYKEFGFTDLDGRPIKEDYGVIQFCRHPYNPFIPILILSGNSPEGVKKAVDAIAQLPYEQSFTGQALIVKEVEGRPLMEKRVKETYAPLEADFTLEDLGFKDTTVRGFFSQPIEVRLDWSPESRPVQGEQKVRFVYSYSAQLEHTLSTIEVSINGVSLLSKNLVVPKGETRAVLEMDIPYYLLLPRNRIVVKFFLYPRSYIHCGRVSDRHLWATLHKESGFHMPRDYYVKLPDLSLLKYDWFPFGNYQDLQKTALLTPNNPDAIAMKTLFDIAMELGKATVSEGIQLQAFRMKELAQTTPEALDFILIDPSEKGVLATKFKGEESLYETQEGLTVLKTIEEKEARLVEYEEIGVVEEIVSPFNPKENVMLIVRGGNEEAIDNATDLLKDKKKLGQLDHNIALAFNSGVFLSLETVAKQMIGVKPIREKETHTWVYNNFWQITLILMGSFIIIYLISSFISFLRRYRQQVEEKRRQQERRK